MSIKMIFCRFYPSREIYRNEVECPRIIRARYNGRAKFRLPPMEDEA